MRKEDAMEKAGVFKNEKADQPVDAFSSLSELSEKRKHFSLQMHGRPWEN